MSMIVNLLQLLNDKGIRLGLDEAGKLLVRGDKAALDANLVSQIKASREGLIEYLQAAQKAGSSADLAITAEPDLPPQTSFAQQRLWLLDQLDGGSAHYNMPGMFMLDGEINHAALSAAFTALVARHESVRTCFEAGADGQAMAVVQDASTPEIGLLDLSDLPADQQAQQWQQAARDEAARPFDLSRDLMLRATLIRLQPTRHVLLVTMHHIASDGWSMAIVVKEFSLLYQAHAQGMPDPLPPLPVQYRDYARWQRQHLSGAVLERLHQYWSQQLTGLPVVHSLPLDRPRPRLQSYRGANVRTHLDAQTGKALHALCHAHGATLFMGLHAAFSVLLARYSNETDIVVGSPIANREQAEVAGLIGFFVNTLVLRSKLDGDPSFISLLQQSQSMLMGAYAHQQMPFEQLVERLQPERSLAHSALFQIMLVLQNNEDATLTLPGLQLSQIAPGSGNAKYELMLQVSEKAHALELNWEYNVDLFEAATIERMAGHFGTLLASLLAAPQQSVFAANLLGVSEREQLLRIATLGDAVVSTPIVPHLLHAPLLQQIAQRGSAIAVKTAHKQLSYAQLGSQSRYLAARLQQGGAQTNQLIAVLMEKGWEQVVAVMGILQAGSAYLPIDAHLPRERIATLLQAGEVRQVVSTPAFASLLPDALSLNLHLIDAAFEQDSQHAALAPSDLVAPPTGIDDLAYVIFTSGSTGAPKGVMIDHKGAANTCDDMCLRYDVTAQDKVLGLSNLNFDLSVFDIFGVLGAGGQLVLPQEEEVNDPQAWVQYLQDDGITIWNTVPAFMQILTQQEFSRGPAMPLRLILMSGDWIPGDLPGKIAGKFPQARQISLGGATEASIWSISWPIEDVHTVRKSIPYGKAMTNQHMFVLQRDLSPAPFGVSGQIHIGGIGLSLGYWRDEVRSAASFIVNPESGARLYRTGDMGVLREDGNIEFLGRIDHQVKIRGFRIELGEIENALITHPAVKDAVVLAKQFSAGDQRLVAYVVLHENEPAAQARELLRSHLASKLPDYMVPGSIMLLAALPLSANGKIDRKALPEPDFSMVQAHYMAAQTLLQQTLCEVWQKVLGLPRIGIHDNFFQLGGHSLLVMQVITQLREAGIQVSARQMFTAGTLAELASLLEAGAASTGSAFRAPPNLIAADAQVITPDMLPLITLDEASLARVLAMVPGGAPNVQDIYPLAPLQEGILFHHMLAGETDPYVMPMLFAVQDAAHLKRFMGALEFLLARHDVLRTVILWQDLDKALQVVLRHVPLAVEWLELDAGQDVAGQDVAAQMQARCEQGPHKMALDQAPLLRLQIAADPASGRHYVLLRLHHIISDHVGLDIIQREVVTWLAGQGALLPPAVPYREFVAQSQQLAQHEEAQAFFKTMLQDVEEPCLPFGLANVQGDGSGMTKLRAELDAALSAQIRLLARDLQISPASLFHTAYAMVLAACTGSNDVVFGTVLSGRLQNTEGAENMLGVFINTLPLRVRLNGMGALELVRQVHAGLLALLPYEQASLALAQRCSAITGDAPLFSALLNYRHSGHSALLDTDATDTGIALLAGSERSNYPFDVSVDDDGTGFRLDVEVDAVVDPSRLFGYMATALQGLVQALQQSPQQAVMSVPVMPLSEVQTLQTWAGKATPEMNHDAVHRLFEQQVARDPQALALYHESVSLSYDELNRQANRLAHYLKARLQIRPDTLIGICASRSPEMIIWMLASLKAGAGYLPLDPEYPPARLAYMLKDAQPAAVLIQSHLRQQTGLDFDACITPDSPEMQQQLQQQADSNLQEGQAANADSVLAQQLAYVIYTSGSTGTPKGVMIEHGAFAAHVKASISSYALSADDRILQFASINFDAAQEQIWIALCRGARLYLRPAALWQADEFYHYCLQHQITLADLPPGYALEVLRDRKASHAFFSQSSLKNLVLGGEAMSRELLRRWRDLPSDCALINAYGPTETVVTSCSHRFDKQGSDELIPIGRPLAGRQCYVMQHGQLVPQGVAGELFIGGLLARGYLQRPDLTAEKFVPNPFHDPADAGSSALLYATGDRVSWLRDGSLAFMGRLDQQIKIRGFRIEPGEVENALAIQPGVREAVVMAQEAVNGDAQLVAYVAVGERGEVAGVLFDQANMQDGAAEGAPAHPFQAIALALRENLLQALPPHMVPTAVVVLESMPLMPSGKIDRKALPLPEAGSAQARSIIAPRTPTERILCDIWQAVLGLDSVSTSDNFFRLGGHSLLLMQVIARAQAAGLALTARQLFAAPTLADLASQVALAGPVDSYEVPANLIPADCELITPAMLPLLQVEQAEIERISAKIAGGMRNIQDIYPLGALQEGILFHHMMMADSDPYVTPTLFALPSRAHVESFVQALQFVIARHDALRTAVLWRNLAAPVQVVCREVATPVLWLELDPAHDAREQMVARSGPQQQWLDLEQAPLLALEIGVDSHSGQHFMLLKSHHIIADHIALELIQKEMFAWQAGRAESLPPSLPYREFVAHSQHLARHNDASAYFSEMLGDVVEPTAPFDLFDVTGDGTGVEQLQQAMPQATAAPLRQIAAQLMVSPATLLHTAWAMVLGAICDKDDVVFGTVLSGRLQGTDGADSMMGLFINTLPLRVKLACASVHDLVLQTHAALTGLLSYEQTQLVLAQRSSQVPAGMPLFTTMLNYRYSVPGDDTAMMAALAQSGLEFIAGQERTNYPLTLSIDDLGNGFRLEIKADRRIDAAQIMARMQTAIAALVTALHDAPGLSPIRLSVLPAAELAFLASTQKGLPRDYPRTQCWHELFEQQVARTPDAVALRHEEQQLSFAELNVQANRVAHFLLAQSGLGPDTLVGLCLDRSPLMLIGLLGILKAGSAYVPLDPAYPASRLAHILSDANLTIVLTQEAHSEKIAAHASQPVCLDATAFQAQLQALPETNIPVSLSRVTPQHLAYVIYTSGSTGLPKGVMVEHGGVVNLAGNLEQLDLAGPGQQWGWQASYAFDGSVKGLTQLTAGRCLHIISEECRRDPARLRPILAQLSVIDCTPLMVEAWFAAGIEAALPNLIIGGEAISGKLWQTLVQWQQQSGKKAVNVYGPTECTVDSHACLITGAQPHLGRVMPNVQAYVRNRAGELCGVGLAGELYLGGVGVARGYLGQVKLTQEKFISNPWHDETDPASSARLYRTGDLVRVCADGKLEFLGRMDHQLKVRGYRIEPGEVESALIACAQVQEALVLGQAQANGEIRLVAYLVLAPAALGERGAVSGQLAGDDVLALRQQLLQSLPEHMLPAAWIALASFPLSPNGKIDRQALPLADMSSTGVGYIAPATATERLLATVWQEVLQIDRVGVNDNFFQLGGHSLLLIKVIAQLQRQAVTLSVRQLFSTPVLGELAHEIDRANVQQAATFVAPPNLIAADCDAITPEMLPLVQLDAQELAHIVARVPGGVRNIKDIYPLAPLQEGILFHHMMSQGSDPYVMPMLFCVRNRSALDAFVAALQQVVARHDVLRTAILWQNLKAPVQVVCREAVLPLVWVGIDPTQDAQARMQALCAPQHQWMDLDQAPLIRLQLAADQHSGKHYLMLQVHHIISDHVGLEVIQHELLAIARGKADSLPAPVPYREFVAHALHQAAHNDAQAFFTRMLGDVSDPTTPFNLHDVTGDVSQIVEAEKVLPASLSASLRQLAQQMAISPAVLFHAAWSMVLASGSGRDDVVFGSVLSGRLQGVVGADHMLGMFINTLPVRLKPGQVGALELVRQTHAALIELLPYEQASLALAQRCSSLSGGTTLFSAIINYRHSAIGENSDLQAITEELGVEGLDGHERTNYPLTLSVDDLGSDFDLSVQVVSSLSPRQVLAYMETALQGLVQALLHNPEQPVGTITVLPPQQLQQLARWNETATAYPDQVCMHRFFEQLATSHPDALAVTFEDSSLTYAQLNLQANRLAHFLRQEKQVKPDTLVGICMERSLDMVVAIIGILKAGGAYVPLDPDYPAARLAYMLEDARLDTVLTHAHIAARTPLSVAQAVCLDDAALLQKLHTYGSTNPDAAETGLHQHHLAYVIYTSGSTGNPKGVMVEHQALVNRIDWMHRQYGATAEDRILQKTPFSFDVSVWEFMWPLMVGARIVLAKPEGHKDPQYLSTLIREQQVSKLHFVPSMLSSMLQFGDLAQCQSVRQVFCSGEALSLKHVAQFQAICPWAQLHNLYGPTEAAIDVSFWDCARTEASHTSVPIGAPIQNIQLLVMNQQLLPQGVAGELHIGGVGLARGYLNRPDLTAEKFIRNPYYDAGNPASSARLYKTGDLVRQLADGTIEYLGRIDHQVKIRGFRIELGEIENALTAQEGVQDAVVMAKPGPDGEPRLVAWVAIGGRGEVAGVRFEREAAGALASTEQQAIIDALLHQLGLSLPAHMLPTAFVLLEHMPVTANGKADRKALPEPDQLDARSSYVAPRSELEQLLCAVWQEVLAVPQIGIHDNFFRLGGHSLLVVQVIARMQAKGWQLGARQLFAAPTVAELAQTLQVAEAGTALPFVAPPNLIPADCQHITPEMLPLVSLPAQEIERIAARVPGGMANIQDIYPLAPLQQGILFHHMINQDSDPYVMPVLFAIRSAEHVERFIAVLQRVIARHDVLRTAILWQNLSQPLQIVLRQASLPVTWLQLDAGQDVLTQMQALCEPGKQWMDLAQAPLVRLQVAADPASGRHLMLLQVHHLVDDVTSLQILQAEIAAFLSGHEASLPTPVPYRNFVAHALHQVAHNDAEAYFRSTLGDVDWSTLPFDLHDTRGDGSNIVEMVVPLEATLAARLRAQSRALLISPAALFHAAWAMVVANGSGRDDVVFGTVLSGRLQGTSGAESMLGMFINTLPLRLRLQGASALALVQQAAAGLIDLLPYEQSALALAQRCSGVAGDAPIFSAMLNYRHVATGRHADTEQMAFDSYGLEVMGGQERSNYPLSLSVDDLGDGFRLDVQTDTALKPELVLGYMQTALLALLEGLEQDSVQPVLSLSLLSAAGHARMLQQASGGVALPVAGNCIHELFEQQVRQRPQALALVFEGQGVSYAELNRRANQLAHYLRQEQRCAPDTLVGLCLDRSPAMIVAILAILKAGAAYVPLDPEYPAARLAHMLEDAALATILTDSALAARLPASAATLLCLDDAPLQAELARQPETDLPVNSIGLQASHLAYAIFTSGSTGLPKASLLNHAGLCNLASAQSEGFAIVPGSKLLQFASVAFDAATSEWSCALASGATLVLPTRSDVQSPADLTALVQQQQVTHATLPPVLLPLLDPAQWGSLQTLVVAGDNCSLAMARLWSEGRRFINAYGPSEATVCATMGQFTPDSARLHIGQPLPGVSAYVVSPGMGLLPPGVAGELVIGGIGLSRGYLHRPALNAEKFVPNPFHDPAQGAGHEILFRTGDLVRWLDDGNLEFLGRIDQQVKLRGFRIELGEIENALHELPTVRDALVLARPAGSGGEKRLVAYVVPADEAVQQTQEQQTQVQQTLVQDWRQQLAQRLPEYMVPASFMLLPAMPLTPNGKIDRKALPEPDVALLQQDYVAASTPTQERLCAIWQELLELEQVGVRDNFFRLGGHSLLATRMVTQVNQAFGIQFPLKSLFETDDLAAMATLVDQLLVLERNQRLLADTENSVEMEW